MNFFIFAVTEPSLTPSELGTTLIGIAFILLVVERVTSLARFFWPAAVKNGDYATKSDISRLEKQIGELTNDYRKLLESSFARYEEFNKTIADIRIGQETLRGDISRVAVMISSKIDTATRIATESHKHTNEQD